MYSWSNISNTDELGWWMTQTTVRPLRAKLRSSDTNWTQDELSSRLRRRTKVLPVDFVCNFSQIYLVGSSKKRTGGLLTNSKAMASRFRSPDDRMDVRASLTWVSAIVSRISSIYEQTTDFISPTKSSSESLKYVSKPISSLRPVSASCRPISIWRPAPCTASRWGISRARRPAWCSSWFAGICPEPFSNRSPRYRPWRRTLSKDEFFL